MIFNKVSLKTKAIKRHGYFRVAKNELTEYICQYSKVSVFKSGILQNSMTKKITPRFLVNQTNKKVNKSKLD